MASVEAIPNAITGGCLCGSICYTVNFTKEFPWPPVSSMCQCTMCRKWTSSLVAQFLVVAPEQLARPFADSPTYKEYASSPRRFRGFCNQCGTSLIWRSEDDTRTFDLFLGTVDEKWLIGEKTRDGGERHGGFGKLLCTPNGTQFYCENVIKGVTDLLKGGREFQAETPDSAVCG
ncbi:Mss4-like protein [Lineolata rhizophorae]|uniref:Mss4-like protein n=1 Tax=Lineolata rhizophorae TaxID=578093 RepID=A0A6A6P6X0_9PEZI|nr:Mss4-like protein [Lineolata rhizophorae]